MGDKIQNALPISSEKFHYSTKTSLQSPSEHNIQAPEYSQNTEKLQLSPADSLAPITFLNAKVKLEEDKQLIVKNNKSLSDDSIVTVDIPETAIITQRHVKEKLQIIKDTADSGKGNGFQEIKTEVERQILAEVEKETIELDEENLLQEQLTQRLAREEEKERQLLDAEDLGELEEHGVGVGNLDLEVAEERQALELPCRGGRGKKVGAARGICGGICRGRKPAFARIRAAYRGGCGGTCRNRKPACSGTHRATFRRRG